MKIIIIDNDEKNSKFITKGLKEELCSVDAVSNVKDGLYLCSIYDYDVIILDWVLPDLDGLHFIEKLRAKGIGTPILMLTAKNNMEDRVMGLERGADDYMTKPFAFMELIARVKALHRRRTYRLTNYLSSGNLKLDSTKREVKRDEQIIELTTKEFKLLSYLLEHKGRIVTNTMILEYIWNMHEEVQSNVVNVTMYHLRKKIDQGFDTALIETIRGSGYKINDT